MMAKDSNPSSGEQPAAKKKVLNLDQLFTPATAVSTSVGTLYLYGLRTSDLSALAALPDEEPADRMRVFLPHVASRVEAKGFKDERPPLATADVDQLTSPDLEQVSEAYAETLLRGSSDGDDSLGRPERETSEPAVTFLDRLLKHEIQVQSQQLRKMHEKMQKSTSSIFDQVRKSSSALGSTLSAFDQFTKRAAPVEIRAPNMDHFHVMNEQLARQARERAEELEMVRLTGKMTAESAKTLKDLAEAATILLEQLDERDKKADQSTRKQISIAVWSVGVSAVLALFALIVTGLAYYQDKHNNLAGDQWQSELLATVRDGNRESADAKNEAQRLRAQIAELEEKIAMLKSIQSRNSKDGVVTQALPRRDDAGAPRP
jgi:hypothetical protein